MFVTSTEPVLQAVKTTERPGSGCAVPVNTSVGFGFLGAILLPKHLRHRCSTVAGVWQEPKAKEIILTMNKEKAKMVVPRNHNRGS
jgi:hypothetical protein